MAKVATGILTLRQGKSPDWTDELDAQMKNWTQTYIQWMETSPIALAEGWSLKYASAVSSVEQNPDVILATTAPSISTNSPRSTLSLMSPIAQRTSRSLSSRESTRIRLSRLAIRLAQVLRSLVQMRLTHLCSRWRLREHIRIIIGVTIWRRSLCALVVCYGFASH